MHFDESIFGIKFDVSGNELREHCQKRASYHEGRRRFYEEEAKKFKDEVDELVKSHPTYSNKVAISNRERMEDSKNHHADRVRFFDFAGKHLGMDTYKMTQAELITFEFIPARNM